MELMKKQDKFEFDKELKDNTQRIRDTLLLKYSPKALENVGLFIGFMNMHTGETMMYSNVDTECIQSSIANHNKT